MAGALYLRVGVYGRITELAGARLRAPAEDVEVAFGVAGLVKVVVKRLRGAQERGRAARWLRVRVYDYGRVLVWARAIGLGQG